jgi:ubiquinone/menaquinone biosynthesis C-methylase UbiE
MLSVAAHYGTSGLLGTILKALQAQGKNLDNLTADDLAAVDEFHIRGREATVELAEMAGVRQAWNVLDVGSGLGGSSRFLAGRFGCRVVGVDLTPEYCEAAEALSKLVDLEELTEFHCESATDTRLEDAAFDLAWTQHVQMNIADKPGLYREVARVLKPGGRFAFHDILAGAGGPPHFPVPWASAPEMNYLIGPDELRILLEQSGFRVLTWRDTTTISHEWFLAGLQRLQETGAPPLGLHLLLGETAPDKLANVARNLKEGRVTVHQGVIEKVD